MALKTLTFDLYADTFAGYTRRKYDQPYTPIPVTSYSADVATVMEAFAKVLEVPLNVAPLTIVAKDGYASRLSGPRVYKTESGLAIRYDREVVPVERINVDDEISFKAGAAKATIAIAEDKPVLVVQLPKGVKVYVPFHTAYTEEKVPALKLQEQIEDGNYAAISDMPGSGGSINFTALKNLPLGRYPLLSTVLKTDGKFGPKIKMTLSNPTEQAIVCTTSTDGVWSAEECQVAVDSKLVVDANTALARSLQGLTIAPADAVVLDVVSKRIDEEDPSKVYVTANLDFSASATFAFKDW